MGDDKVIPPQEADDGTPVSRSLLIRARARDADALRLIYEEHVGDVRRLVRGVLRGAPESEDAIQQTFVKVFSSLPRTEVRSLAKWINTIAYRTALEFLKKRVKGSTATTSEVEDLPILSRRIDEELESTDRTAMLERAIYSLPKRQRLAILGYIHDQSDEQVATIMGITQPTVRVHRFEAIKTLRARLGGRL